MSLDAVTKLGHYSNCGTASRSLDPFLNRYFAAVDAKVQAAHAAGNLNLRSALQAQAASVPEEECQCQSSLHCARPTAPASVGPCDIHGVCGAVCMHTVPVRGAFCDMRTPEQFAYYLYLLHYLVQERPDLTDVYIDFGCQIRSTWARYVAAHPELPDAASQLRIMVNWLHGSGHEIACQLVNSGKYSEGAARRIGEEIEQLWAMTKVSRAPGASLSLAPAPPLSARPRTPAASPVPQPPFPNPVPSHTNLALPLSYPSLLAPSCGT